MNDLYGIKISHPMVANYARTAALIMKPFVYNYDYEPSNTFVAQERPILLQLLSAHKASANSLIFNFQLSIVNFQFASLVPVTDTKTAKSRPTFGKSQTPGGTYFI